MNLTGTAFAVIVALVYLLRIISSEIFTSTFQIAELLNVEKEFLRELQVYTDVESSRLDKLRHYARRQKNERDYHRLELERLRLDPVHVFTSSRKFRQRWKELDSLVKEKKQNKDFLTHLKSRKDLKISSIDLEGAQEAFLRLQIVYNITPQQFNSRNIDVYSDGINSHSTNYTQTQNSNYTSHNLLENRSDNLKLNKDGINRRSLERDTYSTRDEELSNYDKQINTSSLDQDFNTSISGNPKDHNDTSGLSDDANFSIYGDARDYGRLSIIDNFLIGRQAYTTGRRMLAKLWMENTLAMMRTKKTVMGLEGNVTRKEVLNHLAFLEYRFANLEKSLEYYGQMLELDPDDPMLVNNYDTIKHMISTNTKVPRAADDENDYDDEAIQYMSLCRQSQFNDGIKVRSNDPRLTCRYENKHPGTRIKPVAVETIGVDPLIEVFRDVLSDKEIDTLLELATPRLLRAGVNNIEKGIVEIADFRISKTAWLDDDEGGITDTINHRIAMMTGLNTDTGESLQINNYGIGGQYEPHYDHALDLSTSPIARFGFGNRIATLMFYLSDVEAGGATVFIDSGAISKPSKGDAVFWYNLRRSGQGDDRTIHAGCPVLIGNKWVANKWLHEYGNEFQRPCTLSKDD